MLPLPQSRLCRLLTMIHFVRHLLWPLLASVMLASCAVTRVDPPAPVAAPAQYKESGVWRHGHPADVARVPDAWWTLFKDPVLDGLVPRLVVGNENLRAFVAKVASARATLDASRSAMQPTLSAGLTGARTGNPTSQTSASARDPSNSLAVSANASWELDVWGRLSQASTGAQATLQASVDDLAAARLSAQATLVQTYFSLRTADAQLSLLERSAQGYQRSLELTQARYDGGVAARSDVLQAQIQLKSAQAQVAEFTAQRAQLEHAMAVLLGLPPSSLNFASSDSLPRPPELPQMLPSALLERRPDIAAAQRRVAAAYAQIGVADAAYFPALTLTAGTGYRNASLANLVSAPNLFWSLGASLTEAMFDGGQRKLASSQARASADQATAVYRQTVLTALQEVEDNLVLADQLQREAQAQQGALEAAQASLNITLDQYRGGTVSYLNVVTAQTAAFTSEASLLSVRNRQLAAISVLLKNIAGRWDEAQP